MVPNWTRTTRKFAFWNHFFNSHVMRRHLVLIALVLSIALLIYKFESISSAAHARPAAIDEGSPIEPTPRPHYAKGDHTSAVRAALSPTPVADTNEADSKCWERINDQIRTNGYIDSIRPKLDAVVGPWFYEDEKSEPKADETSTPGRFFQALGESGLLEGRSLDPKNEHAMKLFRDVADDDRGNSAPLLFAAVLAEKNGDKVQADRLFEEAKTRPKFNVYMTQFARVPVDNMKSVEDWFEATSVNSRIPVPSMTALSKFLKTRDSASIASAMIQNYPFAKDKPVLEIDFFPLEYAIGLNVLKSVDPQSATLFPDYKTVLRKSMETSFEEADSFFWQSPSKYGCDLHVLEASLATYQARLHSNK
jgi:hypothetical protein